jgi:hypothetical protein
LPLKIKTEVTLSLITHDAIKTQCRGGGVDCKADLDMVAKRKIRAIRAATCTELNRIYRVYTKEWCGFNGE